MAPTTNNLKGLHSKKRGTSNEWAFGGTISPEVYTKDIDSELPDFTKDSGYISDTPLESPLATPDQAWYNSTHPFLSPSTSTIFQTSTAFSTIANNGSAYEGQNNQSQADLEGATGHESQGFQYKTLQYEDFQLYDEPPQQEHGREGEKEMDNYLLQMWQTTPHRHEEIAYRHEEPPRTQMKGTKK